MGMFSYFQDAYNYGSRCVDRLEHNNVILSTAKVSDGLLPYESCIFDARYIRKDDNKTNGTTGIIVEAYSTKGQAIVGHNKWAEMVRTDTLPAELVDCQNSEVMRFAVERSGPDCAVWNRKVTNARK